MPLKRPELINNEIYHIILRGVGDIDIFKDKDDYFRAIFSIYEFNTTNPVIIRERRKARLKEKKLNREQFSDSRDLLVNILTFCFMPNHIHLLIKQLKDKGVTNFMRKFGAGYAAYFNKKYARKGHLFQSRFKAVRIKNNEQLKTVFVYIHTNPISLIEPKWKDGGIKNPKKVIKFLENYKWSSYQDYIGKKNFPSLTEREPIFKIIMGEKNCQNFVESWIKHKQEIFEDFISE